jgi:mRNA interferase MazF
MFFSQGDIVHFNYNPTKGHEPSGSRPSLVISSDEFNLRTSMVIVCPITRTDNKYPLHFRIDTEDDVIGFVCTEQLRAVDLNVRAAQKLGRVDEKVMTSVLEAVHLFF